MTPERLEGVNNPYFYLGQEPSVEDTELAAACDRHNGAHTPFFLLAKVALRLYRTWDTVSRQDAVFRRARRYVLAGASFAAVNLSAAGIWYVHRVEAAAADKERAAALERTLKQYREEAAQEMMELQLDVRELRTELMRRSGMTPTPSPRKSSEPVPAPPGALSLAPLQKGIAP